MSGWTGLDIHREGRSTSQAGIDLASGPLAMQCKTLILQLSKAVVLHMDHEVALLRTHTESQIFTHSVLTDPIAD